MRLTMSIAACVLMLNGPAALAFDLGNAVGGMANNALLERVNSSLAKQQVKDGQFEFKVGKAEFAPGNEKRIKGLLKIITDNSVGLQKAFPTIYVTAEGHTDTDGNAKANQKLSMARAKKVCTELKAQGMTLACKPVGVGSSKPLVAPEKNAVDKQKNRRVLVQVAK